MADEDNEITTEVQNTKDTQEDLKLIISDLKKGKRNAKSLLTRLLTQLVGLLSVPEEIEHNRRQVYELLQRIDEQQQAVLDIMDDLETAFRKMDDNVNATKTTDEAEKIEQQVEGETVVARQLLASLAKKQAFVNSVNSGQVSVEAENTKGKQAAHKILEKDGENSEQINPSNNELHENNSGNSPEDDSNPSNSEIGNVAESVAVLGNLSGDSIQPDSGTPQESGNPPSDSSNTPSHTTATELRTTPLNRNISRDGTHHLERIRIPVFAGDKMKYQQWDAAFTTCVDQAPLTAQFKMLRLESCLRGEAAETIKGLGYSKEAYDAARARLARKYGGSRRQVQSHLEELKKLKPLQEGNAKDLEAFADVLERAVICLKENGRQTDLDAGTLYTIILEKIPGQLLSQYYRWLREHQRNESMETLKDWISQEADYQVQAAEIKHGFPKVRQDKFNGHDTRGGRSYHGNRFDGGEKRKKKCAVCEETHPIWWCSTFKVKSADEKWRLAKKLGLCYRCLGDDHLGNACKRSKSCHIGGCKENHHYLLHREKSPLPRIETKKEESKEGDKKKDNGSGCDTEGDRQSKSYGATQGQETKFIALRTVPVVLKNGDKKIHVNCLLDEGSDTTYVNEDVVEALGLQGSKTKIEVKVANDETVSFMSSTFQIGLESMDGRVDTEIIAQTSKKICGGDEASKLDKAETQLGTFIQDPLPQISTRTIDRHSLRGRSPRAYVFHERDTRKI